MSNRAIVPPTMPIQAGSLRQQTERAASRAEASIPRCQQCRHRMKFIRTVPGYRALPRIDCFHCIACGLDETIVESDSTTRAAPPVRHAVKPREAAADGLEFLNLTRALGVPQQARVDPRTEHLFAVGRRACSRCTDSKARCGELAATGRVAFSELSSICPGMTTIMALLHHWPRASNNLVDRRSPTV